MLVTRISLRLGAEISELGILADVSSLARLCLLFLYDAEFVANSRQSATNLKLIGDTSRARCDAATASLP